MTIKKALLSRVLLAATIAFAGVAHAQNYPSKPIRLIVPYPAGGTTDALARLVAQKVGAKWGQNIIVEDRGGAGGNIGAEIVWRSAPDGYTLLFASPGPIAINKNLYPKLGYDPDTFTQVSLLATTPNVLIVSPKLGIDSVTKLIAYAKAHPDKLNFASQGDGSTSHLTAELFKSSAGIKMTHVPYKGSAPALTDLLGGQVDLMFIELSSALPYIRNGSVRALGVGSEKRNPLLPNVPAIAEGLPGFAATTWFAMVAPPKTPPEIVNKISAAVAEVLISPELAKSMKDMSLEGVGSTPAEMTAFTQRENQRWGSVIRLTGTKIE
jgi:tripartite-type tricarboxylate transporter receptor subunit TctC